MRVVIQVDNEYGDEGPMAGDAGTAVGLMKNSDGNLYADVIFDTHEGYFWVSVDSLLYADTSGTETVYRTT